MGQEHSTALKKTFERLDTGAYFDNHALDGTEPPNLSHTGPPLGLDRAQQRAFRTLGLPPYLPLPLSRLLRRSSAYLVKPTPKHSQLTGMTRL